MTPRKIYLIVSGATCPGAGVGCICMLYQWQIVEMEYNVPLCSTKSKNKSRYTLYITFIS